MSTAGPVLIDRTITLLSDFEWHNIYDVAKTLQISLDKLGKILAFLKKYDFVLTENSEIKLNPNVISIFSRM